MLIGMSTREIATKLLDNVEKEKDASSVDQVDKSILGTLGETF